MCSFQQNQFWLYALYSAAILSAAERIISAGHPRNIAKSALHYVKSSIKKVKPETIEVEKNVVSKVDRKRAEVVKENGR